MLKMKKSNMPGIRPVMEGDKTMKRTMRLFHCSILLIAILMTSCATTTLTSVWKDESYTGQVHDVFVIGIAKKQSNRRIFEDEFVKQFKAHGVKATPSYAVFSSSNRLDREAITSKMKELGMKTVLITSVVDKQRHVYTDTWYDYYSHAYGAYGGAHTRTYTEDVYYLETKLFDRGSGKLIWTALSETFLVDDAAPDYDQEIKSFINVMVKKMKEDNLLQ